MNKIEVHVIKSLCEMAVGLLFYLCLYFLVQTSKTKVQVQVLGKCSLTIQLM